MAYGIYARPVGPGPATPAPLFIDANLTFPQYLESQVKQVDRADSSTSFTFNGFNLQGTMIVIPNQPLVNVYFDPVLIPPFVNYVKGVTVSGRTANVSLQDVNRTNRTYPVGFNAYKIWPTGNRGYGITFSNSADFMSISDTGVVGQCVYAYRGSVTDGFTIPNISGVNMANIVVFAGWSQNGVCAAYDPISRKILITANRSNVSGSNKGATISDMKICVFANGAAIPAHNGGLNIYTPNGQAVAFSTYRTPFVIRGFMSSAGGNSGLSQPMICMTRGVGAAWENGGGWTWQHERFITMAGSSIGTGWGYLVTSWDDGLGSFGVNATINISLPVLEGSDYFA